MNLRNRTILPILYIGFVLITWTCPSYAAKLRDIRVGEYGTYTRIVFEHGDTIQHETLRPLTSGQLSVVFPDTELDLVRKIPMDRSNRLKEMKIWQRQNELSLVLTFAFEHFRYELFRIDQPKRLVLDVYPMTPPATTSLSKPESKAAHTAPGNKDENPDAQPPTDKIETTAVQQKSNDMSDQLSSAPKPPAPAKTIESEPAPDQQHHPARQVQKTEPPPQPAVQPWRLQHYLSIGLVILTLVILVLLLVMLVSKNRWANFGPQIKPNDFLDRQNERIAALDAQIQEQLKHFEKA